MRVEETTEIRANLEDEKQWNEGREEMVGKESGVAITRMRCC
jgi:hypothetical protein